MRYLIGIYMMCLFVGATSCTQDEILNKDIPSSISFHVSAKAGTGTAVTSLAFTRLYVVERRAEQREILYCDKQYDIDGTTYRVDQLPGLWYKFAFFRVPALDATMGSQLFYRPPILNYYNFNSWRLNYKPVLDYQAASLQAISKVDLSVYRKIIDRWMDADMTTHEDVTLERITGLLELQMGKPADQFDTQTKGAVQSFTLHLQTPDNCMLRDSAKGSVITEAAVEHSFTWLVPADEQLKRQTIQLMLLPGQLNEARVTVTFVTGVSETYLLRGHVNGLEEQIPLSVKPNRRTIAVFNGIDKGEFEIRYAGFADGGDAIIDVENDQWDGTK